MAVSGEECAEFCAFAVRENGAGGQRAAPLNCEVLGSTEKKGGSGAPHEQRPGGPCR